MSLDTIDVRDLIGHPGASRVQRLHGTLAGLGTELARVPDDAPIVGDLLLESVVEGLLVTGTISGTWHLRCARCLREVEASFEVSVSEMFATQPDEDAEQYPIAGEGSIDPDQMVRDAVGVELPFSPLCRPDCRGLCPVCGGDLNLGECPGHEQADPRFAALSGLLAELQTMESDRPNHDR
jgi:uncharacterized protein